MPLPEWLIERGIGETRAAFIEDDEITEARIELDGLVRAGSVIAARLTQAAKPTIAIAGASEFLLPRGAPGVSEGGAFNIEITREAVPGAEPWKRPRARATDEPVGDTPPLAALDRQALPREVLRRVRVADARPAEWPAGAGGHVHAEAQSSRLRERVLEHRHPRRRQVRDELLLGAAYSIDRSDLDAAEPDALVRLEIHREVGGIHGAALPPPTGPRPRFGGDEWPRGRLRGDTLGPDRRLRRCRRLRAQCRRVHEPDGECDERRRDARRVRSLVHGRAHRRGRVVRGAGSPQLGHVLIGRAGMGVPPGVVVGAIAAFAASIESARAAMSMRARETRSGSSLAR